MNKNYVEIISHEKKRRFITRGRILVEMPIVIFRRMCQWVGGGK